MSRNIYEAAADYLKLHGVNPVRIYPHCHSQAEIHIYVDVKEKQLILCCSKCDRPLSTMWFTFSNENGGSNGNAGKPGVRQG